MRDLPFIGICICCQSASIAHRDHEGMTAVHWAALKGSPTCARHDHVAEMLMDVGGVHLLHVPDAAGDTPIALAVRKRNRFLVLSFHKATCIACFANTSHLLNENCPVTYPLHGNLSEQSGSLRHPTQLH
eukprot:4837048-Amphidinium_carterae.1